MKRPTKSPQLDQPGIAAERDRLLEENERLRTTIAGLRQDLAQVRQEAGRRHGGMGRQA